MNELKHRWLQLSLRERGLVLGCGVLVIVSLCYYALWLPWQQQASQWQRTIAREQNTVEWMLQQAPRLRQQETQPIQETSLSLSARVAQSAAAQNMNITRMQPQGERLAVMLEPGDFNALMLWITQLEKRYSVRIVALEVAMRPDKPGWVTVNKLMLERSDGR